MAFYSGENKTASIFAVADSSIYILRKEALARLRKAYPKLATRFDHMVFNKISRDITRANKLESMYR